MRTIIRSQNLLLALIRVVIQPEAFRLLSIQRNGHLLSLKQTDDQAERLLYDGKLDFDSDVSLEEAKYKEILQRPLSAKT